MLPVVPMPNRALGLHLRNGYAEFRCAGKKGPSIMNSESLRCLGMLFFVLACGIGGCAGEKHVVLGSRDGVSMQCRLCFDETVKVRKLHRDQKSWRYRDVAIRKHQCPDCTGNVEYYFKEGKAMVRCARCAPAGVDCDRCLPPA